MARKSDSVKAGQDRCPQALSRSLGLQGVLWVALAFRYVYRQFCGDRGPQDAQEDGQKGAARWRGCKTALEGQRLGHWDRGRGMGVFVWSRQGKWVCSKGNQIRKDRKRGEPGRGPGTLCAEGGRGLGRLFGENQRQRYNQRVLFELAKHRERQRRCRVPVDGSTGKHRTAGKGLGGSASEVGRRSRFFDLSGQYDEKKTSWRHVGLNGRVG